MSLVHAAPARRVLYLSGTRADFGLMRNTLQCAAAHPALALAVVATGTHLSHAHGNTVDDIRAAGLSVVGALHADVLTRTPASMSIAVAQCLQGMAALLEQHRPDILLLLGDRGEMLAGAIAALNQGVVTVHVHGGERSGTVDEPMRHAISKLCSYHLVATEESRERLIRMGEAPQRIHVVGAPGLDGLTDLASGERAVALAALDLPSAKPFILAVFHPVVQQANLAYEQTRALMAAMQLQGCPVLWLEPNADAGALGVLQALDEGMLPAGSRRIAHLSRALFAQAMRHAAVMVGNSSSGIIEAASFGTPVVNIGDRQRLRERNANTVDVPADTEALSAALSEALARKRYPSHNRYGDGRTGARIVDLLTWLPLAPWVLEKTNAY
ncbi:GDP/UDP-N,N'-diacetylbacillosamine 2-epimerase (hydrolysing) [Acidovorax sp. 69]|uniref:UDP-N-acetylglucosamine 2-epimerase n=1 Tax=Acidovorax sp. 69 TaxID=2035202 RepID=UPI000C230CE3|nr:UDP-N-acetylglucosamine 2-epimerase [Acidovorax sp. 69]PJI96819.1 GDP/UDP-N,N'-diacetylbacillosamine 2-epimerase (hydrolysing) [Acidovorax sp. 69]